MLCFPHRVHNEVVPACDIASQRMFRGGRTEYIRSPTNQTLKFILAFDDPSVSVRNTISSGICSTDYFKVAGDYSLYCICVAAGGKTSAVQRSC